MACKNFLGVPGTIIVGDERIMRENLNEYIDLDAEAGVIVGNNVYLFCRSFNILYKYNILKNEIKLLSSIPEKDGLTKRLVGKILYWNEQIITLPAIGDSICIYDLNSKKWECIKLENIPRGKIVCFQGFIYDDNFLCMIGSEYPYIVHVNLIEKTVIYDNSVYDDLEKDSSSKYKIKEDSYFRSAVVLDEKELLLGCRSTNKLLRYNYRTKQYTFEDMEGFESGIEGVLRFGDIMLYAKSDSSAVLIKQHKKENKWIAIDEKYKFVFLAAVYCANEIFLLSKFSGKSLHYQKSGLIEDDRSFYFCNLQGDSLVVAMDTDKFLYCGNMQDAFEMKKRMTTRVKSIGELFANQNKKQYSDVIKEDSMIGLSVFLHYI